MYCATSFCEREKSSKRAWMYVESDSGVVVGVADRFMGDSLFRRRASRFLSARREALAGVKTKRARRGHTGRAKPRGEGRRGIWTEPALGGF